jgi:hypothetical protein
MWGTYHPAGTFAARMGDIWPGETLTATAIGADQTRRISPLPSGHHVSPKGYLVGPAPP